LFVDKGYYSLVQVLLQVLWQYMLIESSNFLGPARTKTLRWPLISYYGIACVSGCSSWCITAI